MWKYGWIAALVVVIDQATKVMASQLTAPVTLIPGVLGLTYAENTGMAFSMLSGHTWLLGLLSALLIAGGLLLVRRHELSRFSACAAMMMLGGAIGNMIDRFVHGYVVDMLEFLAFRFPVFNIADSFLTIGCVMTAYALLFRRDDWREKQHGNTKGNDL